MLIKLYHDTNGDNWTNKTNWLSDRPINEWYGITYSTGKLLIDLYVNNLAGSIDLSGCTELEWLSCGFNQLTSINVSGCTALSTFWCQDNQLTSINMNGCTAMESLGCFNNRLTILNVGGFTELKQFFCSVNQLTSLNVSGLSKLELLWCFSNQLTNLNVNGCTALRDLLCDYNRILSEIPAWFSQITNFQYDVRYDYSGETYNDKHIGWWYPGEPGSGYHGSGSCSIIDDGGVEINGVVWATRNVCDPGAFTVNPEAYGGYYQWNRATTAWTADWNGIGTGIVSPGNSWKGNWNRANDPCPKGWHVPSEDNVRKLIDETKVTSAWTTINNINGRKFTDTSTGKTLFLPAAGFRDYNSNGNFERINISAAYWCIPSDPDVYSSSQLNIESIGSFHGWSTGNHTNGHNIRCVKT
jgi:uncharacterized protein (TIGR02145 family)